MAMLQIKQLLLTVSVGCALFCIDLAYGVERVLLQAPPEQYKTSYSFELLNSALAATQSKFGPYSLTFSDTYIPRSRIYWELQSGERLNVAVAPPSRKWKGGVLRVPFPTAKGIASFRVGLVMKKNMHLFKNVTNLKDIKQASYGVVKQWAISNILEKHGFKMVYGRGRDELVHMMAANRFDVFSRGVNEAFHERAIWGKEYPQLVVEPHIAIFTYLPNYFYVSPTVPRLAGRIEEGLLAVHESGALDKMFDRFYGKFLTDADLSKRKIF